MNTIIKKFNYNGVVFDVNLNSNESIIANSLEKTGVWEDNQLCLYSDLIGESGLMVDIGANVGVNSIYAKKLLPNARVICIEPEPINYANLLLNSEGLGLEIFNVAIADHAGEIGFAGSGTNAKIALDFDRKVKCLPLDLLINKLSINYINLLKIDVEGYTDLVLSQSDKILSISNNVIVEFSYGDIESRLKNSGNDFTHLNIVRHSDALIDKLKICGKYLYYISRSDGLIQISDATDLFELMFLEATVGDIIVSNQELTSIRGVHFLSRFVQRLQAQNHKRILEIQKIK